MKDNRILFIIIIILQVITIALITVLLLFPKDEMSLITESNTESIIEKEAEKEIEKEEEKETKKECNLLSFENYTLTDKDKEELAEELSLFLNYEIGKDTLSLLRVDDDNKNIGYISMVDQFAIVYKLNGKFYIDTVGSATTKENIDKLREKLKTICD